MPIREKGYYNWDGELKTSRFKWLPMLRNGINSVYKKKWSKLLFAVIVFYTLFFLFAIYVASRPELRMLREVVRNIQDTNMLFDYFYTFEGTLLFFVIIMSIFAGAELISNDIKFKSFTLYLSRPLSRLDYVKGKYSIVLFYLLMATLVPGILLILFKMIFLGFSTVSFQSAAAAVVFSLLVSLFLASLTVLVSALTASARLVKILIFVIYAMSQAVAHMFREIFRSKDFLYLSVYENIDRFASFIFNTRGGGFYKEGLIAGLIMLVLTLIFFSIVLVRVKRVEV